jgi:hypothetical protein
MARKDAGEAMLQLLNLQESQKNQESKTNMIDKH